MTREREPDEKTVLSLRLEPELLRQLRSQAEIQDVPVSEAVREAVRLWLQAQGQTLRQRAFLDETAVRRLRNQLAHEIRPLTTGHLVEDATRERDDLDTQLQEFEKRRKLIGQQISDMSSAADELDNRVLRLERDLILMRQELERFRGERDRARVTLGRLLSEEKALVSSSSRMLDLREEIEHILQAVQLRHEADKLRGGDSTENKE